MCAVRAIGVLLGLFVAIKALRVNQIKPVFARVITHQMETRLETNSRERFLKNDTGILVEVISVAAFGSNNQSVLLSAAEEAANSSALTSGPPASPDRSNLTSSVVLIAIFLFVAAFALVYCAMTVCTSGRYYCLPRNGG